ncbi:MAG: hypothetical protein ACRC1H_18705, partial [Caldilineaceae bacterium]
KGLARDVAKLDAAGMDSSAMAERLLGPDGNMSFWTQRHFTALNLIEACRSYNALVMPVGERSGRDGVATSSGPRKATPGKSAPARAADQGDLKH